MIRVKCQLFLIVSIDYTGKTHAIHKPDAPFTMVDFSNISALGKDEVTSSNLVISSSKTCRNAGFFVYFGQKCRICF